MDTPRRPKTNPVALITEAASGPGIDQAKLLATRGRDLVLVDRDAPALRRLAQELRTKHPVKVHVLSVELSAPRAAATIAAELAALGVRVDMLVNNASHAVTSAFVATELEAQLGSIRQTFGALVALTHQIAREMVARGHGQILNLVPSSTFKAGPGMAMYHATRSFFVSFSEALALELKGTGVVVTSQRVRDSVTPPAPATGAGSRTRAASRV